MAHRGKAASLQDQMARLHDSMSSRDKRRAQQQEMRQASVISPSRYGRSRGDLLQVIASARTL